MLKFKYLIFLFSSHALYALTTLHVTVNTDDNPGGIGQVGDLRYCINSMNQFLQTEPDDYAIVFDTPMTIQLNGILPIINNSSYPVSITIGNPGSIPTVTIDGNSGAYPGFFIPMGNVTIQNIIFQNLTAQGGNGGNGISGGGGGMGAGGAIYAPQSFLYGSNPSITLMNVSINSCSAAGGNGGSCLSDDSLTGSEGGGGGGGFAGNGGSISTIGNTGGGGGGGFGGNGGDVTISAEGGGGGGGLGSRATIGTPENLGHGGDDQHVGLDGNGYGISTAAGSGGGGYSGGNNLGGGGGGSAISELGLFGGGGGGSLGHDGAQPLGSTPPGDGITPSGGNGADGGGGGGGGIVATSLSSNFVDGQAGSGGYGGGGGGGAGVGSYNDGYTVQGGSGGIGGGGGGGGVNVSGVTSATGGDSLGGGGGGGAGPSFSLTASGGTDIGYLGGGSGGAGADNVGAEYGGGGGGGGSGIGAAIFIDSGLNFTIQALSGIPTVFNTLNNTTQAGVGGTGFSGLDGTDGSALGNSIFLRANSSLTLLANDADDLLTLGEQVEFTDDTVFGGGATRIYVRGNGTIVYNGTTDYQGSININNANFKVNGFIDGTSIKVCRDRSFSLQRGTLSGVGTLTGDVYVNSGAISPDTGETLTLGRLTLNSANIDSDTLGSLVHIEIDAVGTSLVTVTGEASLAGVLEIDIDEDAAPGIYTILISSGITGTFDSVSFTGPTPTYTLSYLPVDSPTFVQLDFVGFGPQPPSDFSGKQMKNNFGFAYELFNQLVWTPSPSPDVAGYIIYRDGQELARVDATIFTYQDHDQAFGVSCLYSLVAFDSNDNMSEPVTVTVSSNNIRI